MSNCNLRWAFNVSNWKPSKEQWKLAFQCIQKEERERCNKFCFVEDCKSTVAGQLLMRKAASEICSISYDKVCFSRTDSGKPYLVNKRSFNFNISHHGDFCVLATSKINVGIDVMKVEYQRKSSLEEYFSRMEKQFSFYEWNFITQPGLEIEQLRRFYRLWCLKESYVKALGIGISCDLQTISFSCPTPMLSQNIITTDTKLYLKGNLLLHWKFEETLLDPNHCVAIAFENKELSDMKHEETNVEVNKFTFLSFEDLTKSCIPFEEYEEHFWKSFQSKSEKTK